MQGYESACGFSELLETFSRCDALIVSQLKACGAVPFAIDCVSQAMMSYTGENPITGLTRHPLREDFSPGGSSGGDACLARLRGAPLALGSDLGGSVRVPAAVCGVFGFCCTPTRLHAHAPSASDLPTLVEAMYGPIASDPDAIVSFLRAIWRENATLHELRDYRYPLTEWRDAQFESTQALRIGFFHTNEILQPLPAVRRALEIAKCALESRGHVVVQWQPPRTSDAWLTVRESWAPFYEVLRLLEHDLVCDATSDVYKEYQMSPVRRLVQSRRLRKQGRLLEADMLNIYCNVQKDCIESQNVSHRRVSAYRQQFMDSWRAARLDAVLCPAFATSSLPHNLMSRAVAAATYCSLFNLMNFCAGVVPVGCVNAEDLVAAEQHWPTVNQYEPSLAAEIRKVLPLTNGMPLAVQLASTPFNDEVVMRLLKEINDAVASHNDSV